MGAYLRNIVRFSVYGLVVCSVFVLLLSWFFSSWKVMSIPTGSMRPSIPPGSLVLMHRVPINTLKVGNIITYINPIDPKETISHRIIKTYTVSNKIPVFVTKGDANKVADQPITEGSVIGKVIWHVNDIGYVFLLLKKPIIILPIVYLMAVLVVFDEIKRMNKYFNETKPYRISGYISRVQPKRLSKHLSLGLSLALLIFISVGIFNESAFALLESNTVSLSNNHLSVASLNHCSGNINNNNSVSVTNNTSQNAITGNSNGSNSTTGNASNNSNSNINITINNC